jgi:transcriptional regulator with XRE-family HTH domain
MHFGEVLKQARERARMTQAALAKASKLSLRTIQSWEQEHRSPVSPDFFKLVRALGVSADAFAGITEGGRRAKAARKRTRKPSGE